jgi:DtxR family transcriptional regulator, Mn-dependent transcriptional regulator
MQIDPRGEEVLERLWTLLREEGLESAPYERLEIGAEAGELRALERQGLVAADGRGVRLTPAGQREAEGAIRRHRLAERLMSDVLVLGQSIADEHACLFEHLLRAEVEQSVCILLGHPRYCPHGKEIPPGPCCRAAMRNTGSAVASVAAADAGTRGTVAYLHTHESQKLRKLMAMGILPGVGIQVEQRSPSYVVVAGEARIAMDDEMARAVFMHVPAPAAAREAARPGGALARLRRLFARREH